MFATGLALIGREFTGPERAKAILASAASSPYPAPWPVSCSSAPAASTGLPPAGQPEPTSQPATA